MASMCLLARGGAAAAGRALRPCNGVALVQVRRYADKGMADPFEHATGIEKFELEQIRKGNLDPFDTNMYKRGVGTKEKPNLIPSSFENRIVGCVCHEDSSSVKWMLLEKDYPRRCHCGYWFKLVEKKFA